MQLTKWVHEPIWILKLNVIHWPWSKVTRIQHFQTSFPEKLLGWLKPKVMWRLSGMGEEELVQKVRVTWPKWPPCPYMVKTWKILLLWNQKVDDLETLYAASGIWVLPNDDTVLTLTYFTARSNLVPYTFVWEKVKTMDFSESTVVYDVKVGRCSQLNEYMKLYEYQRSRSLIDLGPNLSDSIFLNFFSSITTKPPEAKFQMEPAWDGGTKSCSNGRGHTTMMATMPIYGKNTLKIIFSEIERLMTLKLVIQHWVLECDQICSNDAPGLTLTYFMARSNLVPYAFI